MENKPIYLLSAMVIALFVTGSGPYCEASANGLALTSPNGGEVIPSGSTYTIQWVAPPEMVSFELKYSMNNGTSWRTIESGITETSYRWAVPTPPEKKRKCLVKVKGYDASETKLGKDKSDAPFTIEKKQFTTDFRLEDCTFSSVGQNPYFILEPAGYQLILEGEEEGELIHVEITVLNETEDIFLEDIGVVTTRVVEEREWIDGELAEVSRNFFAICTETNSVFYFGEDVDIYEGGEIVSHEGAWRAGVDGAMPGLIMPGTFLLGSRYFQEIAQGVAMDRAEHIKMGQTVETPAGTFEHCVKVFETTPLEPGAKGIKIYAPGVGLIVDETLELVPN